jgi:hypothetical protein
MLTRERELATARRRLHRQLIDVGARDKRFLAGPRHNHHADTFVVLQIEHNPTELVERARVEGVEHLRAVDRDDRDGALAVEQKVVKDHGQCLQGDRIHQPSQNERRDDEAAKQHRAQPELLARVIFRENREHQRDEERENRKQHDVALHHLRPMATS